jgi:protein TonB
VESVTVSTESGGAITDNEAVWACIRTIVVPNGVVPVKRTSPVPFRKRTPLRKHPDGEAMSRTGGREWFGDRLFVDEQQGHKRAGYTASIVVHVVVALLLTAAMLMGAEHPMIVTARSSLVMPVMAAMPLIVEEAAASRAVVPPPPKAAPERPVAAPAPTPAISTPAPIEAPAAIAPESGAESSTDGSKAGPEAAPGRDVDGGVQGGVEGGVAGGVASSSADGVPGSLLPASGQIGPIRSVKPPRKIKDVKPVYPQGAFASQARGTVVILATIGPDGRVQDAEILRSAPGLDHAALNAVRQWEYEPTLLNGAPVAIYLTVVITFGIQ